jgi:ubiquinone/menaquinone biosynthesis C-methylase UbiE
VHAFVRDDGRAVAVVDGFREAVLAAPRTSVQPKPEWTAHEYVAAAAKKIRQANAFLDAFTRWGGTVEGARMLEVGCGAGIDCLLMALQPVESVVGIDRELPLFDPGDRGQRTRRLASEVLRQLGLPDDVDAVLRDRPVRLERMDATKMSFADDSFDLLWSRAAMEHIVPPQAVLSEMARVVRPGGLLHHGIDPFYWLKGCHKGGVVDIPWAHARLTAPEYHRFLLETRGREEAARRTQHLEGLNQLTPRQWRSILEAGPFEILAWRVETWPQAETLLEQHPDVPETLLDGVEPGDLTCRTIKVWLRNRGDAA